MKKKLAFPVVFTLAVVLSLPAGAALRHDGSGGYFGGEWIRSFQPKTIVKIIKRLAGRIGTMEDQIGPPKP